MLVLCFFFDANVLIKLVYTKFINFVYVFTVYTVIKLRNIYISVYTIKICYNFGVHYYIRKKLATFAQKYLVTKYGTEGKGEESRGSPPHARGQKAKVLPLQGRSRPYPRA